MAILRPADGDYSVRGLFLLIGSLMFLWLPFTYLGIIVSALLFGPQFSMAGAIISFIGFLPLNIGLFWWYLNWSLKN